MSVDKKRASYKRIRLFIDIAMSFMLPMLMAYSLIGEMLHEIIGTLMLVLFVLHHVMNRKWYLALFKGKYDGLRIFRTCLDTALLAIMLIQPISGILMSKYLYTFIDVPGIAATVREIHLVIAYWGFVLMSVHAGMHLITFVNKVKTRNKGISKVYYVIWILISIYGVYAFIKRAMPEYMFRRQLFAFIDISESKLVFFAEHASVMLVFMLFGFMMEASVLKKIKRI